MFLSWKVTDIISFILELPSLMHVNEVAEALLHVKNGAWLLCRLVANIPDSFLEGKVLKLYFTTGTAVLCSSEHYHY